ncbi:MAG: hypothetical protein IKJ94_04635 [Oscillospiraceae bacterium]|nr:hypothetical protein [Oscillospiraceae bacterium]
MKTTGCVLAALVIYLVLAKQNKDFSILFSVGVCVMVTVIAITYLEPVFELVEKLRTVGSLDTQTVEILLKSVGIALISEIVEHICQDSGNSSMGKTIQILASGVILWLCVPLFTSLMELIEEILVTI